MARFCGRQGDDRLGAGVLRGQGTHTTGGAYVNYLDRDDDRRVAYGPNYQRLAAVKKAWGPDNVFRMNGQSSAPAL